MRISDKQNKWPHLTVSKKVQILKNKIKSQIRAKFSSKIYIQIFEKLVPSINAAQTALHYHF
jgi:hypothetical protein